MRFDEYLRVKVVLERMEVQKVSDNGSYTRVDKNVTQTLSEISSKSKRRFDLSFMSLKVM